MTRSCKAYVAGVFEHPTRKAVDKTVAQLHAEVAIAALKDAGLSMADVDGYFCDGLVPGMGAASMAEYLGLDISHTDCSEAGGASYIVHVGHAMTAIAAGKCSVALITLAGRPRTESDKARAVREDTDELPELGFEAPYAPTITNLYGIAARR